MKLYEVSWCYGHGRAFVEAENEQKAIEVVQSWFDKSGTEPIGQGGRLDAEEVVPTTYEDFIE